MKVISKLSNVQSVFGVTIRPGDNTIGSKKVKAIQKHPRIKKYFDDGLLVAESEKATSGPLEPATAETTTKPDASEVIDPPEQNETPPDDVQDEKPEEETDPEQEQETDPGPEKPAEGDGQETEKPVEQ